MMNRRELLAALAVPIAARAPSLTAQAVPAREQGKHVLDRFEVFRIRVNQRGDWVLLRTHTLSGLSGLGDCSHSGDDVKVLALLTARSGQSGGEHRSRTCVCDHAEL